MSQFANPSAVAPFRAGYLLLVGTGNGKDGRNGLELVYGAVTTANQMPDFQPLTFVEVGDGGGPSGSSSTSKPTSIVTQNGVYDGAVPFLFALDQRTIVAIYPGCENGQNGVWAHVFSDIGTGVVRVCACQLLNGYPGAIAAQIGASLVPGKSGILLVPPGGAAMWCTLPAFTPQQAVTIAVQPLAGTTHVALTAPSPGAASVGPLGASPAHLVDTSIVVVPNGAGAGEPPAFAIGYWAVWADTLSMTPFQVTFPDPAAPPVLALGPPVSIARPPAPVFLFSSPDGSAWYQIAGSSLTLGKINPDGSLGVGGIYGDHLSVPAVIYHTFDPFTQDQAPGSDPQVVGVYRTLLNGFSEPLIVQLGYARRTVFAMEPAPTQQGVVIGIVESGPPVPNENVGSLANQSVVGTTVFGEQSTTTTGWTLGASIGGFLQYATSSGVPDVATLDTSFNVAFGVNSTFSRSLTIISLDSKTIPSSLINDGSNNDPCYVNPQGLALVCDFAYIGSKLEFLDSNQNPVPDAPIFYEMTVSQATVQALPFTHPPGGCNGGIYPGQLQSYPTLQSVGDSYAADALSGTPPATCAWSTGGTDNTGSSTITQGSTSLGAYLNFNASISAKVGPPGESISVSAGVTASFNFNYQWSSATQDQFSTGVTLPALDDPAPPGAYASYGYYAYLLKHDVQHTEDLIAVLKANPDPINVQLLKAIAPQSAPWKIAYAISGAERNDVALAAQAEATR